jgi:hypothetical protein
MTIEILKVIISICTGGSVMDASPETVRFRYSDTQQMLDEKLALHKAGFNSLSHGNALTVMSPAN